MYVAFMGTSFILHTKGGIFFDSYEEILEVAKTLVKSDKKQVYIAKVDVEVRPSDDVVVKRIGD